MVLKIRQDKRVINQSVDLALGVHLEGHKELLGLWLAETEGSKFWLSVLTELQNRGLKDILIACVDGLKGFPDAIASAYRQTQIQRCIVHRVRNSLKFVPWKDYQAVTTDWKKIYPSATEEQALGALQEFSDRGDQKYPQINQSWRANWENLNTLFEYPPADTQSYVHHPCHRVAEQCHSQSDQKTKGIPDGRLGQEGALPGHPASIEKVEHADSRLETSAESIYDFVRRPRRAIHLTRGSYTEKFTVSGKPGCVRSNA